ncbi:MAG: GatB/YqeY domain-containing protein [Gammaproteobacteria bacterium]
MTSPLYTTLQDATKSAMKAGDKKTVAALRLVLAAIKQQEVDQRIDVDDNAVLAILTKLAKQRKESIEQYQQANRQDLIDQEQFELELISNYLPEAASEADIAAAIDEAIAATSASTMKDMGKVMGILKSKLEGRADFGALSKAVKSKLSG